VAGEPAVSALADAAAEYIALRQALGFKLAVSARLLPDFVAFADRRGASTVTVALALDWAQTASSPSSIHRRIQTVRGFARWFRCLDPASEVPPAALRPTGRHRQRPYLFSDADISALMTAAADLRPQLRATTTETVIGLLTATGMRIGEVLRLKIADVDFDESTLTVWHSKFDKSRLLPLSASTLDALADYQRLRRRLAPGAMTDSFFVSAAGRPLSYGQFRAAFAGLLAQAAIPSTPPPRQPHIHDLRHRFAVVTVSDWYRQGLDVATLLPQLSTYLGHLDPMSTYWYLTATPELLSLAAQRLDTLDDSGARS
jgi:integrase/recombinase XerD